MSIKKPTLMYMGDLMIGGTCRKRAEALSRLGFDVHLLDMSVWGIPRLHRSIEYRVLDGPSIRDLNTKLVRMASELRPALWIDKGRTVFHSTLVKIKRLLECPIVHYTADPAFSVHTSRHFRRCLRVYDLCITNKRYALKSYIAAGAAKTIFAYQGVAPGRYENFSSPNSSERVGSTFIGHCEPAYVKQAIWAKSVDADFTIHGAGWANTAKQNRELSGCVASDGVWGDAYPKTLAGAKVGLGFLCKAYLDQFTTRSFEIPAAGAALLAERTVEHSEIFEEGVEAEFYSGREEFK